MTKNTASWSYWILVSAIIAYVAVLTQFRSEKQSADAWEHHRAVLVLSESLWPPSDVRNCTYATNVPSIRYSPYSVGLALLCRYTPLTPYQALSLAAVANTLFILLSLWFMLGAWQERRLLTGIVVSVLLVYGEPPAYANSLGLSDLPWHQVNPSAFAMGLGLLCWGALRHAANRIRPSVVVLIGLATATAILTHAMTGFLVLVGLGTVAVTAPQPRRARLLGVVLGVSLLAAAMVISWPWFSFVRAVQLSGNPEYWFNWRLLLHMLTVWCLPACVACLTALPYRREPLAVTCFAGTVCVIALGLLSIPLKSALLMRIPLAGLIFPHILIGMFLHRSSLLKLSTWKQRLVEFFNGQPRSQVEVFASILLLWCSMNQVLEIVWQPYLARPLLAPVLGRENKQPDYWRRYSDLLADVGRDDVVLADELTGWPVPSFNGRLVAALHWELFDQDQPRRSTDLARFLFGTRQDQRDVLQRYNVRWILVDRRFLTQHRIETLVDPLAVVKESGELVLLDAHNWMDTKSPITGSADGQSAQTGASPQHATAADGG